MSDIKREDMPKLVKNTLIENYAQQGDKDKREKGAFYSQSLRKICRFLDDDDIIRLKARRSVTENNATIPLNGGHTSYMEAKSSQTTKVHIDYNREDPGVGVFDSTAITDWLDQYTDVYDLPVSKLVFKFDSQPLRDQLYELLTDAIGFPTSYKSSFESPFHAVMTATPPGAPHHRQNVRDRHDEHYFTKDDCDGKRGLGWRVQTMDLDAVWSIDAWTGSSEQPFAGMTMEDVEALAFNHDGRSDFDYGALYTPLVINKWRQSFSRGMTGKKSYSWLADEGHWEQTG